METFGEFEVGSRAVQNSSKNLKGNLDSFSHRDEKNCETRKDRVLYYSFGQTETCSFDQKKLEIGRLDPVKDSAS